MAVDPISPEPSRRQPTATAHVSAGGVQLRVRPWRGRRDTAECSVHPPGAPVPPRLVSDALERSLTLGYSTVVTPALPPFEWRPYLDAGFEIRERLHLLAHHLLDLPSRPPHPLRRVRRRDRDHVLDIDAAAFEPFWRLDEPGLDDAIRATPSTRFRISADGHGYALVGRAGDRGYVQRLAVLPDAQGAGLGTALVVDGLAWLRRWRVREALVNTQERNERAVALYERLGFRIRPGGLAVLQFRHGHSSADVQPTTGSAT